jgi:type III pantothenate kinase
MSAILLFDIGNDAVKTAHVRSGVITDRRRMVIDVEGGPIAPLLDAFDADHIAVSSVVPELCGALLEEVGRRGLSAPFVVSNTVALNFKLLVEHPDGIGADRLCAAAAARSLGFEEAVIVDAGTAVTVDILSREGFRGGAIFPGLELVLGALHGGTALLPRLNTAPHRDESIGEAADEPTIPGGNTEAALAAGAVWGLRGAVRYLVEQSRATLSPNARIVITGGGAPLVIPHITGEVEYDRDLVMRGLLSLLSLNHPEIGLDA